MTSRTILLLLVAAFFIGIGSHFAVQSISSGKITSYLGSVFFIDSTSVVQLDQQFQASVKGEEEKIKILIVPGHDDEASGTEFRGLREADVTLAIGKKLAEFLNVDRKFDVILARDDWGYTPALATYLTEERDTILDFAKRQQAIMNDLIQKETVTYEELVDHNFASPEVAAKLYGINKWANERSIDIVLHIHVNDYPRRTRLRPGEYSGFAIYVPERQYSNAKASRAFAEVLSHQLEVLYPISDMPKEKDGIVEDQELIAIGSNNSLDAVGVLVEYGYIYETKFQSPKVREAVISDLAFQTYLGINRFFKNEPLVSEATTLLPYTWQSDLKKGMRGSLDVLALQAALKLSHFYPAKGFDERSCPLSGDFADCTFGAVKDFQRDQNILPSGIVGPVTREALEKLF